SHTARALACFHYELERARIEPTFALVDELINDRIAECSRVLFSQLKLNFKAALVRHPDNVSRRQRHIGETFAAFDAGNTDIGAQIEIGGKLSLGHGNLEWASTGNGRHFALARSSCLSSRRGLISNHPARHGDLENRHQMCALLKVPFQSQRIVAGIKRTGGRRNILNANALKIIVEMKFSLPRARWGGRLGGDWLHCFLLEREL